MSSPAATPFMKRSQYAAHIGKSPSYITQLAAQGRVVFTPDGRFVDVSKTDALLAATADPAKQPVADRHAAARGATGAQAMPQPQADDGAVMAPPRADTAAQAAMTAAGNTYQQAKAIEKRYQALEAKRAYDVAMGQLRDAREVEHAVATAFTATRTALQGLATTLAPVLAATTTEEAARTEMATAFEAILAELSTTLAAMATSSKQAAHP